MNNNCIYCDKESAKRASLMIKVADLSASELFLMRDQYYRGRCIVAFKEHCTELYEMSAEDRNAYFADVAKAAEIVKKLFSPGKINYGIYGDGMPHVHMHIVPKYPELDCWGSSFELGSIKREASEEELNHTAKAMRELL